MLNKLVFLTQIIMNKKQSIRLLIFLGLIAGILPSASAQKFITLNLAALTNGLNQQTVTTTDLSFTINSFGGPFDVTTDGLRMNNMGSINLNFNKDVTIIKFTVTQASIDALNNNNENDESLDIQNFADADGTRQTYSSTNLIAGDNILTPFQVLDFNGPNPDQLTFLGNNFNMAGPQIRIQSIQVEIVPEPSTYALFIGIGALAFAIRKRTLKTQKLN
jgi:hypothetical protein